MNPSTELMRLSTLAAASISWHTLLAAVLASPSPIAAKPIHLGLEPHRRDVDRAR